MKKSFKPFKSGMLLIAIGVAALAISCSSQKARIRN
jgi:hypothetical protein